MVRKNIITALDQTIQPFSLASWFPTVDQMLRVSSSSTQCWWDCIWKSVQFWALHLEKDVENMERVTLFLKWNILVFLNQRRTFCFHCSLRCFVAHTGTIIWQQSFRYAQIPIYPKALHESKVLRSHWVSLFLRLPEQAVWTQSLSRAQWNEIFNPIAIFIPGHQRGMTELNTVRYYSSIF